MMEKMCQSCAMPLVTLEEIGTNEDGNQNQEYCIHCYQNGKFTNNYTMEEMVETNLKYLNIWNKEQNENLTEEEARHQLLKLFPTLKRWRTCTDACANPECHCTDL